VPVLVLGVIDVPYDDRGGGTVTTSQVAQFLENKYHVMGTFVEVHKADIERRLIDSVNGALEDLFSGAPVRDPYAEGVQGIKQDFSRFLYTAEMEKLGIAGVPTGAALKRRSLRFKDKKAKKVRPSFIDTSTYELSFRAWTKE